MALQQVIKLIVYEMEKNDYCKQTQAVEKTMPELQRNQSSVEQQAVKHKACESNVGQHAQASEKNTVNLNLQLQEEQMKLFHKVIKRLQTDLKHQTIKPKTFVGE